MIGNRAAFGKSNRLVHRGLDLLDNGLDLNSRDNSSVPQILRKSPQAAATNLLLRFISGTQALRDIPIVANMPSPAAG